LRRLDRRDGCAKATQPTKSNSQGNLEHNFVLENLVRKYSEL
jgi:hypothetical protein